MGLIFKALFSISTAGLGSKQTQGYSYDDSVPSRPPIKGQHPLLGNGPKSLSSKAVQAAKAQRNVKRRITTSAGSTTESSTIFIPDTPQILHKIETRSTTSTSLKNWKLDHSRRSWEKDTRWSRPTTSTSFVSSTLQRPTTGYIPASLQKKPRHLDSLPNESNSIPRLYYVDLLDAHSSIRPSETLIRDREQASGTRSYGEDVADRNMPPELPELPVERMETPQGSRPLIDSPELKFLKEIHLANKRAVGMTDNESSSPPPSKSENEKSYLYDNQVKKLSHPHSHPLRSLFSISDETYRSAEISTVFDRTRSQSLSKLSQPKPLPNTTSNDEAIPKDDVVLLKNLDSPAFSQYRVYNSPKSSKGHPTPGSKESLDSQKKYQESIRSRRHTYSSAVFRRIPSSPDEISFSFQQNPQLIPSSNINSPPTKRLNPSLSNTPLQNVTDELNQKNFSKGVRDDDNTTDGKITGKNQTAINKKENPKFDDTLERKYSDITETNYRDNGQKRYSLKKDSIKIPQRCHVPFSNTNKSESKVDEVLSSNHSPNQSGIRQEPPLPYLRHEIPQKSPDYSPAEAPTIRFDRNRSLDHAGRISFQEIQTISGPTKNDLTDSPVIAATRERLIVTENAKNSIQKPKSLPKNMSSEILNPVFPSKKDYMRNETSLGTQYVWHLRPLLDDNKLCSKTFNTDRGGTNIRRFSLSQNQYNNISVNNEFCVSEHNVLSPKDDNLFFGEDNFGFDFANMLPGLQMIEPHPMTRSTFSQNA